MTTGVGEYKREEVEGRTAVIGCPGVDKPGRRRECTVLQPLYANLPAAWLRVATVNLGTIEIFKLFLSKVKFTSLVVKMNSFFKENNTNE